ncbi:protocadherin Fat 2 [Bombina bombina]|uniref:protocadherin Fat 2 n=1 Tax=Bombina bombina TaxID=8345 RepID=UPI00235A4DE9|nr:protocadherin Fat 2 [Bombina bombina]
MGIFTKNGMISLVILFLHSTTCQEILYNTDSSPFNFTQSAYHATIYENSAPKTYVVSQVKMGIYLKDPQWTIKYRIVSGDSTGLFKTEEMVVGDFCFLRIRIRSGNTALLNREVKDNYQLIIYASEKNIEYEVRTKVIIQVLDINDLRPLFLKTSYMFKIKEDAPLKTVLGKISATDADLGQNAMFYYKLNTQSSFFCIHPTSGIVMLVGKLNATERAIHKLEILAVDRMRKISEGNGFGNVAYLEVLVEQSIKKPPFISSVTTTLPDSSDRLLYATLIMDSADQDCNIDLVEIVSGDPIGYFKVVRSYVGKNEFTIVSTAQINWLENPHGFNITLRAKDKSRPPTYSPLKTIYIPPWKYALARFEQEIYKVQISECAPPGSRVTLVKIIPEIPSGGYHFKTPTDKFKIIPHTGLIFTNRFMDVKDQSQLEVIALNGQISSTVIVDILDCNNHAPVFMQASYQGTFNENVPIGTKIVQVSARDGDLGNNGVVTYNIASPKNAPFIIDKFTGVIRTSRVLDYELTQRLYHLTVWASDWGSPFRRQSSVHVSLILNNLNDNAPVFENVNCNISIPRDLPIGEKVIALSAVDIDELQNIQYEILAGNELQKFKLDSTSGVITIRNDFYGLPDSQPSFYSLFITANDGDNNAVPNIVNITLLNEGSPVSAQCEETGVLKKIAASIIDSLGSHSQDHGYEDDTSFNIHLLNSHIPKFDDNFPISIDVPEDTPVNSVITQLSATDLDMGFNGQLVYAISDGADDGCFAIDMESGKLIVLLPLDRETASSYILNITVYDLGTPQRSSWKILAVNLIDANDNAPCFPSSGYCVTLPEDSKIGTTVLKVKAEDNDMEDNGKVKYSLLTPTDTFAIDSITGELTVKGRLDRELLAKYRLKIEARDQPKNDKQQLSITDVVVTLEDVNDNTPHCTPLTANVKVPEDLPLGTVVYFVEALDTDIGANGEVSYALINDELGIFQVDKLTGAVILEKELDFEKRSLYNLTVRATDAGHPFPHSSICHMEVEVLDVNENLQSPYFQSFVFQASVPENSPPGTTVRSITAQDEDKGKDGEIRYSIRDGTDLSAFSIDEESGAIRTEVPLDRESVSHYWLTIYATDMGTVPLFSVAEVYIEVTDINDNIPQLSHAVFYASVPENSPADLSILQLEASDADSISANQLSYQFSAGNSQGFFRLNPNTGLISTTNQQLDRETKEEHILEVMVSDNGAPPLQSMSRVVIQVLDMNDNAPTFPQKLFTVQLPELEASSGPSPIYRLIALDRDKGINGQVKYSITEPPGDTFIINPITGIISSKGPFSAGEYHILTVKAADNGSPPRSSTVRLHIQWINNPAPSEEPLAFDEPQFTFEVMETDPVNQMIGLISTEFTNGQTWFQIIGGDDDLDFDIDKSTGGLVIARPLQANKKSSYNLTVQVTDGSSTISTQVFIKVIPFNRHRPEFLQSHYEIQVSEDVKLGTEVLKVRATDKNSGSRVIYTIHGSADPRSAKMFRLDPNSGALVVTETLDFESMPLHILNVMVRDQKVTIKRNFARVTIQVQDYNDHSPHFIRSLHEVSLPESAPPGTEIVQVRATDKDQGDNAKIKYSIQAGNSEGFFNINAVSGVITVANKLEKPMKSTFTLTISAADQGTPQLHDLANVNVQIKSADTSPPKFTSSEHFVEISELLPIGSFVTIVSATGSSSINYEIKGGDAESVFYINCYSGIISTQKKLDYEVTSYYQLKVHGKNAFGYYSDTTIFIYIIDENDNAPFFTQTMYFGQISEDAIRGSMVTNLDLTPLIIQATDNDTEANALLTYEILDPEVLRFFQINPSMGTLFTVTDLDYEMTPVFHFDIYVHDEGSPCLYTLKPAKVIIHVIDINDTPPKFLKNTYETSMYLPAYNYMQILNVSAIDVDSEVTYGISTGNTDKAFSINPKTGQLTLNNPSILPSNRLLTVTAWDGVLEDSAVVKINVSEISKTSLKFLQEFYTVEVAENVADIKVLNTLDVIGNQLNEPLYFSVLTCIEHFKISTSSGVLQTTGLPMDREKQSKYDVMIEVRDIRKPQRVARSKVEVYITDVNDNVPEFINTPYFSSIEDGMEPGDVIFQVSAIDKDSGKNSVLTYWLVEDYKYFRIDPFQGDIVLKKPFDFEALNQYVLRVGVKDNGEPSLQAEEDVVIIVRNKSNPIFQSFYYTVTVPENVPINTPILHIQARSPEGFRVIYNIVENEALGLFSVDFRTGALSISGQLDYEIKTRHTITVRATDTALGFFSEVKVAIEVEDINDHAPRFSQLVYISQVIEGLPPHRPVISVFVSDKDSGQNQEVSYHILGNNTDNVHDYFHINVKTGLITTAQELDYEARRNFLFKVRAIDNGLPPLHTDALVIVNISDINDNPPVFREKQYEANISELANYGHIVIKVQALDQDTVDAGKLEYLIISGNSHRHFIINRTSGIISLSNLCRNNLDLSYHLQVSASDGVYRATAPVYINVTYANKHSPSFQQDMYEKELAENADIGTSVIDVIATDPDDGPYGSINYIIINKLASEKFSIDGTGHITTLMKLDRENATERVISIKVMARDGGGRAAFCTVKIILTDENDNAPQFKATEYTLSVQSSLSKGIPIIQVVAFDADEGLNADVTYSVEASDEELLQINPSNGIITAKKSLFGLENQAISFTVIAKDGAPPHWSSFVPVHIEIVPIEVHLPRFSEPLYSFSASEDLPTGSEVGLVKAMAVEPIIYSLVEGTIPESNKDGVFTLNEHTGALIMRKGVDHEKTKWYLIDVQANCTHLGKELVSLVSVSIQVKDINDNQPIFEADVYRASLTENMPAGTTVIQVTANDQDTGRDGMVSYSLKSDSEEIEQFFNIDSDNGWITTLKELDCETQQIYRFYVVASDQGRKVRLSSETIVEVAVVDDNDNPPWFTSKINRGSVVENSPAGQILVTLKTQDKDMTESNRKVTCYITDGDSLGQFSINEVGDQWVVSSKKPMDREEEEKHLLKVTASDGKFQATTEVEIIVLDINDNSPECQQMFYTATVPENALPGIFILKVSAKDPDIGNNAQIAYTLHGLGDNHFRLDPHTGELTTLATLDREQKASYNLVAKATDGGGLSCQTEIFLQLEDVNDNAPLFSMGHYTVTVFDNTTIRTPIAVVLARDSDEGLNSEIYYSIPDSVNELFSVEESTGVIHLENPLEDMEDAVIELPVCATDRGSPHSLSTCTTITVSVVALSYYRSIFGSPERVILVPEDKAVGSELLNLSDLTKDSDEKIQIRYEILNGNDNQMFRLTPETGALYLNRNLDFEVHHQYYLSIEGTKASSPPLSDVTVVVINVTDVNDHKPVFTQEEYEGEISENAMPGDLVLEVSAEDKDGPNNNKVLYTIVKGDPLGHFSVHPERGDVRVLTRLDREKRSSFSLVLRAIDNGLPAHFSEVVARIQVTDENDNPPMFLESNYSLVLLDGSSVGTSVIKLLVTDNDSSRNGPPFYFSILDGNYDSMFQISTDGLLSTTSAPNRFAKDKYLLHIQVKDSGVPHLSSSTFVKIQIIDRSRYSPSVLPLEIFITTNELAFRGSVLGKLHATDQDPHDTLMYTLAAEDLNRGLFSVGFSDGKVIALESLQQGHYVFNITVSDGTFYSLASVNIYVWCFSQEALDQSLILQFKGLSPEEFIADHWRSLQRFLGNLFKTDRQQIQMAGLQKNEDSSTLDLLLVPGKYTSSIKMPDDLVIEITRSAYELGQSVGLQIAKIFHLPCQGPQCMHRTCQEIIQLDPSVLSSYSTARLSVITPRYTLQQVCSCNNTAVRFSGQSFLSYRQEGDLDLKLQFHIKTHQSHSALMFTNGSVIMMLELVNGALQFRLQCGGHIIYDLTSDVLVNNGNWHQVILEVSGSLIRLLVNGVESAQHDHLSQPCPSQYIQQHVFIGAVVQEENHLSLGFQGCLHNITINGQTFASLGDSLQKMGTTPCCDQLNACSQDPCPSNRLCAEMPYGGYSCLCHYPFMGSGCDLGTNPCAPSLCHHGRTCSPMSNGYTCSCPQGYEGDSCQFGVRSCLQSSCLDHGICISSSTCNCSEVNQAQLCAEVITPDMKDKSYLVSGPQEIVEILGGVLAVIILVGLFVVFRKRVCQGRASHKPAPQEDPDLKHHLSRDIGIGTQGPSMELNILSPTSRNQLDAEGQPRRLPVPELLTFCKPQVARGPAICSVAPNLPPAPPSSSDNESIAKNNWDCEENTETPYWPPSYIRAEMEEYPAYESIQSSPPSPSCSAPPIPPLPKETETDALFGGFPFPLASSNKRAPLPPCYSNRSLEDLLPQPSHCQDQYTAISYYPSQLLQPEGFSYQPEEGYRHLSVRLSVAQPSYADCGRPLMAPPSYLAPNRAGSDYGSCEEVMF